MATLNDVHYDKPIEIYPYFTDGLYSRPVEGLDSITLNPDEATEIVNYLIKTNQKSIIEETLQSLAMLEDRTRLKTAFPTFQEFSKAIKDLDKNAFSFLFSALDIWQKHGCNEVNINFVQRIHKKEYGIIIDPKREEQMREIKEYFEKRSEN